MPGGSGGRAPRESADLKKAHKRGTTHRVECEPTHSAGPLRVTSESLLRSVEPPRSRWHRTHSPQPTRSEVSPAPHAPSRTVLTRVVPAMRQSKRIACLRGLPSVALRSDSPIRQGESNPPTPCQPHRGDTDRQTPLRHSRRKNVRPKRMARGHLPHSTRHAIPSQFAVPCAAQRSHRSSRVRRGHNLPHERTAPLPAAPGSAQAGRSHARFEDHRRCAFPDYMDVHPSLVESDKASGRHKPPTVPQCSNDLVYGATHQHDGACAEEERKNHKRCVRPHQVSIRLTPVWIANSAPVSARGQSTKSADLSLQADESLGCFSWRL